MPSEKKPDFTLSDGRRVKTLLDVHQLEFQLEFCFITPLTGNRATYSNAGQAIKTDTLPQLKRD